MTAQIGKHCLESWLFFYETQIGGCITMHYGNNDYL